MSTHLQHGKIASYIDHNSLMTLSTVGQDNIPHGAIVFACADDFRPIVYFLTKNETQKFANLVARPHVSLTAVNKAENSTLQLEGRAFVETDSEVMDRIMKRINRAHSQAHAWLPPIAQLQAGAYKLVGVQITHARLGTYSGAQIGGKSIFSEATFD